MALPCGCASGWAKGAPAQSRSCVRGFAAMLKRAPMRKSWRRSGLPGPVACKWGRQRGGRDLA